MVKRALVACGILAALAGCGGDRFSEPESAAEALVEAFRENDAKTYCPRLRIGMNMTDCESGEIFELHGSLDVRVEIGRSEVTEVTENGDAATARLSRGGALGLKRENDGWVLICLVTGGQLKATPGDCPDAERS